MRYILKRDSGGYNEWGVFDVRRQSFVATGLTLQEARETADLKNKKNAEEVNCFLDENILPK